MEVLPKRTLTVQMPLSVLAAFRQTADEFAQSMRVAAAIQWYERGMVSQETAAEVAGLCREEFLSAMSSYRVSPFPCSTAEILKEAGYDEPPQTEYP